MSNNSYLDRLENELRNEGIEPLLTSASNSVMGTVDDEGDNILSQMQKVSGIKYSDEQIKILKHKGNMCILACAGSGKTSVITHLITKRIKTGEIRDTSKMIFITYSKAGTAEMSNRLDKLMKQMEIGKHVDVKTIHAFFLQVLRIFGVSANIIKGERQRFVREACREAGYKSKDEEDLMVIDNLLSYQVNELLSDAKTIGCYANTLDGLSVDQYSMIRAGYAAKKAQAGLIDYDDMQSYLYLWLCKFSKSENAKEVEISKQVRDYCQSMWTDFYIDEAQDICKIQFEIIRAMVTKIDNPDKLTANLVFVGDDDQCLINGTQIITKNYKKAVKKAIEKIEVGNKVAVGAGNDDISFNEVLGVASKNVNAAVREITTEHGYRICGTLNHVGFVKNSDISSLEDDSADVNGYVEFIPTDRYNSISIKAFGGEIIKSSNKEKSINSTVVSVSGSNEFLRIVLEEISNSFENIIYKVNKFSDCHTEIIFRSLDIARAFREKVMQRYEVEVENKKEFRNNEDQFKFECASVDGSNTGEYSSIKFGDIQVGMHVPVKDADGNIGNDRIIDIKEGRYNGYVYDLCIPTALNFIANGIVVHNCIYKWRGSDPSIILSIGTVFDMPTFVLSTNYRCKAEVVDYATRGVLCNSNRFAKSMNANSLEGSVKIAMSKKEDLCSLSIIALNHIKWLVKNGEKLDNIAVLSRNNFHLALLSNMLLREGIYCRITNSMRLTKSPMYNDVKSLISICEPCWESDRTSKILWKTCRYMSVSNAKAIAVFQDASGLSLTDALGFILTRYTGFKEYTKQLNITSQAISKLDSTMYSIKSDTYEDLQNLYYLLIEDNKEKALRILLFKYIEVCGYIYKSKDKKRSVTGLVTYILNLIKKDGYEKMKDFLRVTEQFDNSEHEVIGGKVTLTTIHSAKGREWKNVIMFGCDNVTEPSFDGISKMVEDKINTADICESIEEERRLVYVGNTRAKENLLVITYEQPSVFILESLGIISANSNNDLHIIDMATGTDTTGIEAYRDHINEEIRDKNSKYYYDFSKYTE